MIRSAKRRWLVIAMVVTVAVLLAVLLSYPAPSAQLAELRNIEDLRNQFNHDKGRPRLILLLSPT
jgi:hypothetical protein